MDVDGVELPLELELEPLEDAAGDCAAAGLGLVDAGVTLSLFPPPAAEPDAEASLEPDSALLAFDDGDA